MKFYDDFHWHVMAYQPAAWVGNVHHRRIMASNDLEAAIQYAASMRVRCPEQLITVVDGDKNNFDGAARSWTVLDDYELEGR